MALPSNMMASGFSITVWRRGGSLFFSPRRPMACLQHWPAVDSRDCAGTQYSVRARPRHWRAPCTNTAPEDRPLISDSLLDACPASPRAWRHPPACGRCNPPACALSVTSPRVVGATPSPVVRHTSARRRRDATSHRRRHAAARFRSHVAASPPVDGATPPPVVRATQTRAIGVTTPPAAVAVTLRPIAGATPPLVVGVTPPPAVVVFTAPSIVYVTPPTVDGVTSPPVVGATPPPVAIAVTPSLAADATPPPVVGATPPPVVGSTPPIVVSVTLPLVRLGRPFFLLCGSLLLVKGGRCGRHHALAVTPEQEGVRHVRGGPVEGPSFVSLEAFSTLVAGQACAQRGPSRARRLHAVDVVSCRRRHVCARSSIRCRGDGPQQCAARRYHSDEWRSIGAAGAVAQLLEAERKSLACSRAAESSPRFVLGGRHAIACHYCAGARAPSCSTKRAHNHAFGDAGASICGVCGLEGVEEHRRPPVAPTGVNAQSHHSSLPSRQPGASSRAFCAPPNGGRRLHCLC